MEFEKIKQLISDVSDSKLTSVDIEFPDGTKINMKKEEKVVVNSLSEVQTQPTVLTTAMSVNSLEIGNNLKDVKIQNIKESKEKGNIVKSPMVGTFYSKPAPDKDAFVKVGDNVKKSQVVCIIEAMKLMNEIESEFEGRITEIFVNNGEMVEYGKPLFRIV